MIKNGRAIKKIARQHTEALYFLLSYPKKDTQIISVSDAPHWYIRPKMLHRSKICSEKNMFLGIWVSPLKREGKIFSRTQTTVLWCQKVKWAPNLDFGCLKISVGKIDNRYLISVVMLLRSCFFTLIKDPWCRICMFGSYFAVQSRFSYP